MVYYKKEYKKPQRYLNPKCDQCQKRKDLYFCYSCPKKDDDKHNDQFFKSLEENFDAVVLAGGAEDARQLGIPGAEMPGVRLAMEFLTQQNKRNAGDDEVRAAPRGSLLATGKNVVVIGGGDTGSDCVGTSNRT